MKEDSLIHVYCMPGLAANPTIFENIELPKEKYEIHWLDWLLPKKRETLNEYAQRLCKKVKHDNIVLIGVSFGGVVVQEMAQFLTVKRLIIISSVKCQRELPRRMRYAKSTGFFRILPTSLAGQLDFLEKLAVGDYAQKRIKLYRKYLSITDTRYLDWAIAQMVCWDKRDPMQEIVHIHGDKDEIFPHKYIEGCITVPGGTHVMIINRFRWFNEHLDEIIETGKLQKTKEEQY
ncbi:alpha/beta hydrolase [Salinimicrobium marinum]|uniref:Alpha/beta hydrolase n=1 Tax=Salinimicrobium marinum TaxID=680283 RepID=A0A918SGI0_9FLAO|nr:alpha/beta hydrolase [Salinimicrobium marinum]GHA41628.1 alpha/beta hydrolase [Salinimicrobium marinum]